MTYLYNVVAKQRSVHCGDDAAWHYDMSDTMAKLLHCCIACSNQETLK